MTQKNILANALKLLEGVPRFDIEVSLKCNINCAMCPRDKITRPKGMMAPGLMDALAYWLPDKKSEIFFCGLGEPLLNHNIYACLSTLHKKKHITGITSNGLLLTPETIHRLIHAKVDFIHISFPSLKKAVYEKIMKGARFEKALEHLKYLSEVKPKHLRVELAFTEQEKNAGEKESVKSFARDLDFGFQHNLLHSRGGHFSHGYKPHTRDGPGPCAVFTRNHFITCEGDILACCHDLQGKTRLGNIKDISFTDLLDIKKSRIIKNRWFGICAKCDDTNRFKDLENT